MRWGLLGVFIAMGAVNYLTRALFTVLVPRGGIPPFWERFLEAIPVAALTAMVAPAIWTPEAARAGLVPWPAILGAAVSLGLARRTRGILLPMAAGTAVFLLLSRLAG